MTLPSLIIKNQNKALEASLKKNYSVIQQAFAMYQAQNGVRLKASEVGNHELKQAIMPYFNVLKDCGWGTDLTACIIQGGSANAGKTSKVYKTYSNKTIGLTLFDDGQFILNDGSLIMIENSVGNPVYITVDVNGYNKNPNKWGHDLFTFELMNDGRILPMGAPETLFNQEKFYCSINSTDNRNGIGCTYKALTEKDYFNNLPR